MILKAVGAAALLPVTSPAELSFSVMRPLYCSTPAVDGQLHPYFDPHWVCCPEVAVLQDASYAGILDASLLYLEVLDVYCDSIQNRCMALIKIVQGYCHIKDVSSALHYWLRLKDLHITHYGGLEFLHREAEMIGAFEVMMQVSDGEHCFKCFKRLPTSVCGKCKQFRYCSSECQKADWPKHKMHCKK